MPANMTPKAPNRHKTLNIRQCATRLNERLADVIIGTCQIWKNHVQGSERWIHQEPKTTYKINLGKSYDSVLFSLFVNSEITFPETWIGKKL